MKLKYQRRNYIIKKGFQGRFVLRFIVPAVISSLLAVIFFNMLAYRKIDTILYSMKIPSASTSDIIFKEIVYANIFAAVIIAFILFFVSKRMLHKIKQPLNRIRVEIMKVTHGDLRSKINLRGKDEFKELADNLNLMIAGLNLHFSDIKNHVNNINEITDEIERIKGKHISAKTSQNNTYLINEKLSELTANLDSLEKKLRVFEK